jgi:predicted TIM-barrel fold metal-dependent hydrolase
MWRDHRPYNDPAYDPVWAACQAAKFPVHVHSGEAPREEMNEFIGIYLAEVVWWTHRPIAHLLFSGAFERFPGLKFVVTEGASYWVADMKWKWDQYLGGGHTTKKMAAMMKGILSKLPSEYFGENIFVGASTMSKEEIRRRHAIGCDVAMWGTDYPHPEGTWPNTKLWLRDVFTGVPVNEVRAILGDNVIRLLNLDRDHLEAVAARIGPSVEEITEGPPVSRDLIAHFDKRGQYLQEPERDEQQVPAMRVLMREDLWLSHSAA